MKLITNVLSFACICCFQLSRARAYSILENDKHETITSKQGQNRQKGSVVTLKWSWQILIKFLNYPHFLIIKLKVLKGKYSQSVQRPALLVAFFQLLPF